MKSIYLFFFTALALAFSSYSQGINDGLRYSTESTLGSARFTALSGAMGSLGGDLSAISINPASSAVFMNSTFGFTGSLLDVKNKNSYFGNTTNSFNDRINLNQLGAVMIFDYFDEGSKLNKITLGVNLQTYKNHGNEIFLSGVGNQSIASYFLGLAQGMPLEDLETQPGESVSSLYQYLGETQGTRAQTAFLGYQGYIFDPVDPNNPQNTVYTSNVAGSSFNQDYLSLSKGGNNKFSINMAAQVAQDFYFGANLNMHILDFQRSDLFVEKNDNNASTITRIGFGNELRTYGSGFSAQVGGIARIADNFRLGLALETPTWHQINEETSQYLETDRKENNSIRTTVVNPRVVNVFEEYTLKSPGKITVSAAYVFGQSGLISIDYAFRDYSNMRFSAANSSYFHTLNENINNYLTGASTLRAGAEYRINNLSLRGGFHFEESPYKEKETIGDTVGFSLGSGYNFGKFKVDLAYSRSEQDRYVGLYGMDIKGQSKVNSAYNNFIISLNFNM